MSKYKKILFITATRAEFGKIKTLINILKNSKNFKPYIFITGVHTLKKFGSTYKEILNEKYENIKIFKNYYTDQKEINGDLIISQTIIGLKKYVSSIKPDLLVIHGDRHEALAGAIVGCMNNILTAHIEGGELSGNIDEIIRHSVSKLSHIHFPSNANAKKRIIQMGEKRKTIFNIGSPDIDILLSRTVPKYEIVKKRYDIPFKKKDYGILIWHPDSINIKNIVDNTKKVLGFVKKTKQNYIVIYPNNDYGNENIINLINLNLNSNKYKIYPSIRFENFISLLKNSKFIVGNSSCGIREAPYFGLNIFNLGNRQNSRSKNKDIYNIKINKLNKINFDKLIKRKVKNKKPYGYGNSNIKFLKLINSKNFWKIDKQKIFSNV